MKRQHAIELLADIGRNPKHLNDMTNADIRQALVDEAPRLEKRRQHLELMEQQREQARQMRDLKTRRHQRNLRRQQEYEAQQRQAEMHRLRVISSPLPPIRTAVVEAVVNLDEDMIQSMIRRCKERINEFTEKFRESGKQEYARMVNDARATMESLRGALR